MTPPLISVITPTYNRPLLLRTRSIPSVLRQTWSNWELIVVGEGPPDAGTRRAVESFGDRRIRYCEIARPEYGWTSPEHKWYTAGAGARNHGLTLARGDIIAALDDDDEFLPHHLADCAAALGTGEYDFSYGFTWIRDLESGQDREEDWYSWADPDTERRFLARNIIFHSSVAYTRALADVPYPTDGALPADYGLWLSLHARGARFTSLDRPQVIYYGDALTSRLRVSVPSIPDAAELMPLLDGIFQRRTLSNSGPLCCQLEEAVAKRLAVPGVVAAASADLGMIVALAALAPQAGSRRELVMPSYAHPSLANAALWNGFVPVFCDVDVATLCITPETVQPVVGPDSAGIAALHPHGYPCDMPALERLAREHDLMLVGDAAAGFGASVGGRPVGGWGDVEIISLSGTKALTAGEGGLICSRREELLTAARRIGRYGIGPDSRAERRGINAKLGELPAALALAGLPHVDAWLAARRRAESRYRERLASLPQIRFPEPSRPDAVSGCKDAVLILPTPSEAARLREVLGEYRIDTRPYYRVLHDMPAYTAARRGELTVTERVADCTLCVPLYNDIRPEVVEYVCDAVSEALR